MSVTTLIKTELDRDNKTIDKILFYLEQHKTILNKTAILFLHKKIQLLHKCVLINEIILQQYEAGDLVECRWCRSSKYFTCRWFFDDYWFVRLSVLDFLQFQNGRGY